MFLKNYAEFKKIYIQKKWVSYLILALFIDALGAGIYSPYSMLFFIHNLDLTLKQIGLLLTISGSIALLTMPLSGELIDRIGVKNITVMSFITRGICTILIIFNNNIIILAILMGLSAIGSRSWPIANQAIISKIVENEEERTSWYSSMRVLRNIGYTLGGLLSMCIAIFIQNNDYSIFIWISSLSLVFSGIILTKLNIKNIELDNNKREKFVFPDKILLKFLISILPLCFIYVILTIILPVYVTNIFPNMLWIAGATYTIYTLLVVFLQIPLITVTKKFGNEGRLFIGTIALIISYLIFMSIPYINLFLIIKLFLLFLGILMFSVGEQLFYPSSTSIVTSLSPNNQTGQYISLFQLTFGICNLLGPLLLTSIGNYSYTIMWGVVCALNLLSLLLQTLLKNR